MAGPRVFICRDCVEMTIAAFVQEDKEWADTVIEVVRENRERD